jgi:16S rRNA (cytidine1402-2'-O)-methyltransferase
MAGKLFLVPNLLGIGLPERVLPLHTIEVARALRHYVAENAKAARSFLKTVATTAPIQSIAIAELHERMPDDAVAALLAPAKAGFDLGLVSDAGTPAVADPGARLVAAAHRAGIQVVPLVGPSSILLALMGSGLNGQGFVFHGYLPVKSDARVAALQRIESEARRTRATQIFIETPYRNAAMLESVRAACAPETMLVVAADLTLPSEEIVALPAAKWRARDAERYRNRPAIFLLGMGSDSGSDSNRQR